MDTKEFEIIFFADDAVIVLEDDDTSQRLLYIFETKAKKLNMLISVQKLKFFTVLREPRRCKLAIYNKSVEQTMSFKYLGVNITSNRKPERRSLDTNNGGS